MQKKKQNINSSEDGGKKRSLKYETTNISHYSSRLNGLEDCVTSHRHLKDKRSWIRTMELNNTTWHKQHQRANTHISFQLQVGWRRERRVEGDDLGNPAGSTFDHPVCCPGNERGGRKIHPLQQFPVFQTTAVKKT